MMAYGLDRRPLDLVRELRYHRLWTEKVRMEDICVIHKANREEPKLKVNKGPRYVYMSKESITGLNVHYVDKNCLKGMCFEFNDVLTRERMMLITIFLKVRAKDIGYFLDFDRETIFWFRKWLLDRLYCYSIIRRFLLRKVVYNPSVNPGFIYREALNVQ